MTGVKKNKPYDNNSLGQLSAVNGMSISGYCQKLTLAYSQSIINCFDPSLCTARG